jgi:C4-dicarboxylate-specific signal transduction histidine kinase
LIVKKETQSGVMEQMLAQLATCQKLVLLGRLASSITHEVNNHLTGVTGYAQLLMSQERAQPIARELDKINYSANKCQKLIRDFKQAARFGGEKEFDNVNLIIQYSLDLFRYQFAKKSLEIVENYSPDIPAIEVDTPGLEQVFLSIIQNSFEALVEKGSRLVISTRKEDGQIVIAFEDDGCGLSEMALEHLFTPFFTTKERLRCSGLGLAAAKVLVEQHKGAIKVDNLPAGGACVKITLPLE